MKVNFDDMLRAKRAMASQDLASVRVGSSHVNEFTHKRL